MNTLINAGIPGRCRSFWTQYREPSLHWLALGLLLAAWNADDDEDCGVPLTKPKSLQAHPHVSVRAVHRALAMNR